LITGGQQGIGLGIAAALAAAGFRLTLAALPARRCPRGARGAGAAAGGTRYYATT
jgi:NAD(P)-dependent dehydrogenase (short-subunit alcohol dehydrogenase family)